MSNRYLVIIDNGGEYSSHRHWPICVCDTEQEAKNVSKSFKDWLDKALDIHYNSPDWYDADINMFNINPLPAPFTPGVLGWDHLTDCDWMKHKASILPIPIWATL